MHPGTPCIPGPGANWHKMPSSHLSACLAFQERVAGCKLPVGSCSWTALSRNYPGKCSLAPEFVQRNFLTIFSRGCTSSAWARLFFPAGMQPSCSRIYLQGEMLQVLPSSSHPLGSGPRLFFQILSKCADEGERFCITSLHQRDTAPCMKRSGLQDLTLGRIWLRQPQSCRLFHNC